VTDNLCSTSLIISYPDKKLSTSRKEGKVNDVRLPPLLPHIMYYLSIYWSELNIYIYIYIGYAKPWRSRRLWTKTYIKTIVYGWTCNMYLGFCLIFHLIYWKDKIIIGIIFLDFGRFGSHEHACVHLLRCRPEWVSFFFLCSERSTSFF
jgi:hypothetical protein